MLSDLLRAFLVSLVMLALIYAAFVFAAVVCPPDIILQALVALPLLALGSYFALPWLVCRPAGETAHLKRRMAAFGAVVFPLVCFAGLLLIAVGGMSAGEGLFMLYGGGFLGSLMAVRYVRLRLLLP